MDFHKYVTSKGFILTHNVSDEVLVYKYLNDQFLLIYYSPIYHMVQVIYNDDFNDPLYSDSPTLTEFHLVLSKAIDDYS